jgi:dTDP-4-dehydrorhamnose reductase
MGIGSSPAHDSARSARRIAITGAGGQLGRQLVEAFERDGADVLALRRPDFDVTRPRDLERLVGWRPDIVVNSAAWTDVDGCARDPERAMAVNGNAAGAVAAAAARCDALVVQVSTNEVFDGTLDRPYVETDTPNPINPYGASKLAGERAVAAANPRHLIVRTAWLFGPGGSNFVTKILAAAERARVAGQPLRVVEDEWGNPTWTPALASLMARLVGPRGPVPAAPILHLAGRPPASRYEWARVILLSSGVDVTLEPISGREFVRPSTPPARALLATTQDDIERIAALDWREATERYARTLVETGAPVQAAS